MGLFAILCCGLLATSFVSAEIKNKGWWRDTVFYQIYPRSFMDSNDDGVGDLKGIASKLEYFVETGIGAIWLSPIYASPMVDFGYDISDFKDIDSAFGTMKDFEDLVAKAKKLGLKVILDLVPNHTSDKHEWFQKSLAGIGKYKDYYMWETGKKSNSVPPNNWVSLFSGPAWKYEKKRDKWYLHQFEYRQPDLNYSNPEVQGEMEDVIIYWLKKGIDGFRVDAVPHLFERNDLPDEPRSYAPGATERDYTYLKHIYTKDDPRTYDLVASWRKIVDDYADRHNDSEKVIMTEAYTNLENTTRFYKFGSHIPFNFKFIMEVNYTSKANDFKHLIDSWMKFTPPDCAANWVMGNHDRKRIMTRYMGKADHMIMLEMLLPGIAVTYYGEEIGMEDKSDISWEDTQDPQACNAGKEKYQSQSRDPCRTPFQWNDSKNAGFSKSNRTWLPVHQDYRRVNLAAEKVKTGSHYDIYKRLINLRNTSPAVRNGTLKTYALSDNDVLAVVRESPKETVIILISFVRKSPSVAVDITQIAKLHKSTNIEIVNVGSSRTTGPVQNPKIVYVTPNDSMVIRSV